MRVDVTAAAADAYSSARQGYLAFSTQLANDGCQEFKGFQVTAMVRSKKQLKHSKTHDTVPVHILAVLSAVCAKQCAMLASPSSKL